MNVAQIIAAKRDGAELGRAQIEFVIQQYAAGEVPDYQMSALAMAIYFRNMTRRETVDLTRAMRDSGQILAWDVGSPVGDKHSTGGIGDKISIPLAPALAAAGLCVPMVSGRGLGPTGGTLDKLESIPGYRCDLSTDEFRRVVAEVGCSINGATPQIAPADRKLYALRDVTGTVPSIPLITASILSKKLAAGLDALVLDVKWGSGAFMQTVATARALANRLVEVGSELGLKTTALITDMNQPLGYMVGNANEIAESIDVLQGAGPDTVRRLVIQLGGRLLVDCQLCENLQAAEQRLAATLDDGSAMDRFASMVNAHGGRLEQLRPVARRHSFPSRESGFVSKINCQQLGLAVIELGGGRKKLGDAIDHSVGLDVRIRVGDWVDTNRELAGIFCDGEPDRSVLTLLGDAFELSESPYPPHELIVESIGQ